MHLDLHKKDADLWIKCWELLADCVEKEWDLDVKRAKAQRARKEKKAMTKNKQHVLDENEMSWQRREQMWLEDTWQPPELRPLSS